MDNKIFLIIILSFSFNLHSQSLSRYSELQNFLQRMETRGLVPVQDYNDFLTLDEMENRLNMIDREALNAVESEELGYLIVKYLRFDPRKSVIGNPVWDGLSGFFSGERYSLFQYSDSSFSVKLNPVIQVGFGSAFKESRSSLSWGWALWGKLGDNFEFGSDFMENSVTSKRYNRFTEFSQEPGHIYSNIQNDSYEFSETNGSFLYFNDFMTVGITKEKMKFGSGIRSQFVLSEKAPTFPSFYLELAPVDWLNIYSMHGWLISRIIDTTRTYKTVYHDRTLEFEKYYVMHALQIKPLDDLSITLGETIIYSDRGIYPGYFIPFLFFRSVDHQFTFGSGESGNNGSIFAEITGRPIPQLTIFSSIYIDEISLSQLLKGETSRNQFGYTVGLKTAPFQEYPLTFAAEYTRILPWVYSNWIPTQTYRNAGYLIGHYLGQNADQIYAEVEYHHSYKLKMKLWGEHIRRGDFGPVINQYTEPGEPFLYGKRRNETNFGFDASYQVLFNAYIRMNYRYSDISDEDLGRTLSWELGANHSFSVQLSYGM